MIVVLIAVGVVLVVVIIIGASYNRFVRQRNLIDNSWSNIDTELKRRYDLIPNLVETVKGYASPRGGHVRGGDRGPQRRPWPSRGHPSSRPAPRTTWSAASSRCWR